MLLDFRKFRIMQLSSLQSNLSWLLLPAIAVALVPASDDSETIGTNALNLVTPRNLSTTSIGRIAHCKPDPDDPDDPYVFTSSLNHTFPGTPPINESFLASAGLREPFIDSKPFDCFVEIPGGIIVFEVCIMSSFWNGDSKQYSPFACNITLTSVS